MLQNTKSRLRLASIKKAAEWADVHPQTIRRWVAAGTLTGWQAAGARHIKVNLNELEEIYRPVGGAQ